MTYISEPTMRAGVTETIASDDRRTYFLNRVSWGAIFAGLAAALVVQLLINLLGIGIGAASITAINSSDNPDASTFSMGAAAWWTVSGIVASFVGGVVAGRLSGTPQVNTARWHGFVSWCATTLVIFYLLTSAIGGILGGTFNALSSTVSGLGKTAASTMGVAAQGANGTDLEARVKRLVNPSDAQNVQDNLMTYMKASLNGDPQSAQAAKEQAVNSLAKSANVSPDEARNRIDQLQQQYQQAADHAKQQATQAAEAARKGIAQAGLFGFIALLLGAVAAWFGGGIGTPKSETMAVA